MYHRMPSSGYWVLLCLLINCAVQMEKTCRERLKILQAKITARHERVKLLIQRGAPDDDPLDT